MNATRNTPTTRQIAITLGFWSAILPSVFTSLFVLIAVGTSLIFPIQRLKQYEK